MSQHLYTESASSCHGATRIIVQSREGGFVSQNCIVCGDPKYVAARDVPDMRCGRCKTALEHVLVAKNYGYRCPSCGNRWELWRLVPFWHELFPYHGLGIFLEEDRYLY